MGESTAETVVSILFVVGILVWTIGGLAFWVWAIVDLMRTPEASFRLTGREKSNWVLVVVLVQVLGAWSGHRHDAPGGPPTPGP